MNLALRFAARSDIGLGRYTNNQDSAYAGPHLLAVADGMGGHAAGDVASSTAIARLVALDEDSTGGGDALERLTTALSEANQDLRDRVADDPGLHGMGTTVTALLKLDGKLALAHIGDSRAYLLRSGRLTQITHDHTFVQSLVDDGRLTEEEARSHPQRNLITRVLTGEREDTPDLSVRDARPGDTYLLCSDGLTGVVTEETLAEVLGDGTDVASRAEALIDLALKGGSSDNVTCVVADVLDLDLDDGPSTSPEVVGAAALHEVTATAADSSTPAGKAAALAREATASGEDEDDAPAPLPRSDEPRPKRHKGMLFLLLVLVVALVLGGGYGAYAWSQRQYFVGADAGTIAIYKGLPQDVGPVHLSSVYERQDLAVDELPSYWRDQVQQRITASTLNKARQVVSDLRDQAAVCASATATATATASGTATATPSGTATATPSGTPSSTATATSTAAATATGTGTATPSSTATSAGTPVDTGCGAG
jgi:protein phosphatase